MHARANMRYVSTLQILVSRRQPTGDWEAELTGRWVSSIAALTHNPLHEGIAHAPAEPNRLITPTIHPNVDGEV